MGKRKFRDGEKVRVVADVKRLCDIGIHTDVRGDIGPEGVLDGYIDDTLPCRVRFDNPRATYYFAEADLESAEAPKWTVTVEAVPTDLELRNFNTGAIRDTAEGKLNYIKGLSPIVDRGYLEYLDKHRKLPDGSMREFDNWKNGIPQEVYLESLDRHERAVWLICHGYKAFDNRGEVSLKDSLYGVLFNTIGMLHEILDKEVAKIGDDSNRTKPAPGGY